MPLSHREETRRGELRRRRHTEQSRRPLVNAAFPTYSVVVVSSLDHYKRRLRSATGTQTGLGGPGKKLKYTVEQEVPVSFLFCVTRPRTRARAMFRRNDRGRGEGVV